MSSHAVLALRSPDQSRAVDYGCSGRHEAERCPEELPVRLLLDLLLFDLWVNACRATAIDYMTLRTN